MPDKRSSLLHLHDDTIINGRIEIPIETPVTKEEDMNLILEFIHAVTQVQPPHPLFVHFPIALTSAALFFILLALWKRSKILEQVAFANISLAAVSSIVTLSFGIRDNIVFFHVAAPNYIVKIILASILFIITSITAIARWRNKELFYTKTTKGLYIAAYCVSFGIVVVLGFLGAIIVYGF
jgi:uncharacterized membrane protein